ncbi:hypothetical protein [Rodentibacter caecimuris]|nr:hypothetical protein [Rodentibacter heylii]
MNDAVFKFKRYENSSLEYAGLDHSQKRDDDIGLYSTVVKRQYFEH